MKNALPARKQSVQRNIAEFASYSPSRKIRALEKQRKILAYLRSLKEVKSPT